MDRNDWVNELEPGREPDAEQMDVDPEDDLAYIQERSNTYVDLVRAGSERDMSTSVRAEEPGVHYGKSGRPYVPDVVGTWHQDEPRIEQRVVLDKETGIEAMQSYMIPEGNHLIYGAMSVDRQEILDAAVAFRGFNTRTQENEFVTQQLDPGKLLELEATRQVSLEPAVIDKLVQQVLAQEQKPTLSLNR